MQEYSIRPATLDDAEVVHRLITDQNTLDFGDSLRTVDDVRRDLQAPNFDLKLDSFLAIASNNEAAAYAEVKDREDVFVNLSSRHRNSDLASLLLGLLEDRIASQKTSSEPVEVWGRAGYRDPVLIETFETCGYKSDISFLIMEVELTHEPPAPKWPDEITVRAFRTNQDEQATWQTDEEAAQDKGYHDPLTYEKWAARMGMDKKHFDPGLWFLAFENDELAGVALNVYRENATAAWVDHLSVRRKWRNKGVGKALLLHTFGEFFGRGIKTIKLSVDSKSLTNAPRLYESVGMQTVEKYHIYKKVL